MKNPLVTYDLKKLRDNICMLSKIEGINFLFPVKCCTFPIVLQIISESDFGFDISNYNEYDTILPYLSTEKIITASGPLSYQLSDVHEHNIIVFHNNLNHSCIDNIHSLRVNFNDSSEFEKSHFGVAYSLLSQKHIDSYK